MVPGRAGRPSEKGLRVYRRGQHFYVDLRAHGGGRPALRDPRAPGWPNAGERTDSEAVAREWAVDYVRQLRAGRLGRQLGLVPARGLAAAVEAYLEERQETKARSTAENDGVILRNLMEACPGAQLHEFADGEKLKQAFRAWRRQGYQRSTRQTRRKVLHTFFAWAGLEPNPTKQVELEPDDTDDVYIPTDGDLQRLRDAASEVDAMRALRRPSARRALELGLGTGMREQELFAIREEAFDPVERTVRVTRQLSRRGLGETRLKGKRARTALVLPSWWDYFRPTDHGYVLERADGRAVGSEERHKLIHEVLMVAGLYERGRGWHLLRHRYAYDVLKLTGRIDWLSAFLGHSRIQITEDAYGHLRPADAVRLGREAVYGQTRLEVVR